LDRRIRFLAEAQGLDGLLQFSRKLMLADIPQLR